MVLSSGPLVGAAVLQLLASITDMPRTASPERHFPHFAEQKAALTPIVVVADVSEFEMKGGKPAKVYVADCRRLGSRLADTLAATLAAKGYPIRAASVVGVALGADEAKACRVYPDWASREFSEKSLPVGAAPFWVDSSLGETAEARDAWQSLARGTFGLRLPNPKKDPTPSLNAATALRGVLGADYVLVAVGRGTKNEQEWVMSPPTTTPFGGPVPGGLNTRDRSRSEVRIALIDARDGKVLWADRAYPMKEFNDRRVDEFAHDLVAAMP